MYIFGNRFEIIIESEVATSPRQNTLADKWYVATTNSNNENGFGISHETLNFKGSLGQDINPKDAGVTALLICCSLEAGNAQHQDHLWIFSDSKSAVRALQDHKLKSKMQLECIKTLNSLALTRRVTVIWSVETDQIRGNILAKERATTPTPFMGPKPLIPSINSKTKTESYVWRWKELTNAWSFSQTGEHTRRFLLEPNVELTKSLLPLRKADIRTIVGMITGHTTLVNSYKNRIGIRDDPDCDRCTGGEETAEYLLCFCQTCTGKRIETFGKSPITPREIMQQDVNNICIFLRRIGKLGYRFSNGPMSSNHTSSYQQRDELLNSSPQPWGASQQTGQNVS